MAASIFGFILTIIPVKANEKDEVFVTKSMIVRLLSPSFLEVNGRTYSCTIGRNGIAALGEKREGDLKTPTGSFPLRCCYYRPDRVSPPKTTLPLIALTPEDGWCDDPAEKKAFDSTLAYLTGRGLEVIVAVFPLMPATVTPEARDTTIKRYADYLAELSARFPFRTVDMSYDSPLEDGDFMADMDHVTLDGNRKFSAWALENDLAFLKTPR